MNRNPLTLLSPDLLLRALDEAFQLLQTIGVRVSDDETRALLCSSGARMENEIAFLPEALIRRCLATAPAAFALYNRNGEPAVHYQNGYTQFDPGSCAPHILDPETLQHRNSTSADLINIIKVTEKLPQFAAQSTAVVCHDVPADCGDLHRLRLVLQHCTKPVVTGAFSPSGIQPMIDLLLAECGGAGALRSKPRAVFDVCPSPPLHWTDFACRCLILLGRAGIPVEMVSMPLAGATAPVTLIGSIVQHTAESLAGVVIHQLSSPGAPIVWGGAPAIFDMRSGSAPLGAMETAMIGAGFAQIGRSLNLPTHTYLCATDAKRIDAQSGMESALSALVGAQAGINLISGAGMLDSLNCFSLEKLVLDAEAIASIQRLQQGIATPQETLALGAFQQTGLSGDFLKLQETRRLFRTEQHLPSPVIDRGSLRVWQERGQQDAFQRARQRIQELLADD